MVFAGGLRKEPAKVEAMGRVFRAWTPIPAAAGLDQSGEEAHPAPPTTSLPITR
jgi:hypothetical protein